MDEKYYKLNYDGKEYVFDSEIMKKEDVHYFKDYNKSMTIDEVVGLLNEQNSKIKELEKKIKKNKTKSKTKKEKKSKE